MRWFWADKLIPGRGGDKSARRAAARLSASPHRGPFPHGGRQQPVVLLLDDRLALAAASFEAPSVKHSDMAGDVSLCDAQQPPRQPCRHRDLRRAAGVRMLHVPLQDVGAMLSAVASGDVPTTPAYRPFSKPVVRTCMHPWTALVVIAGTALAVAEQLRRDIVLMLDSADVRSRAEGAGFEITPSRPQALNVSGA